MIDPEINSSRFTCTFVISLYLVAADRLQETVAALSVSRLVERDRLLC